jgi:hypothetical protein
MPQVQEGPEWTVPPAPPLDRSEQPVWEEPESLPSSRSRWFDSQRGSSDDDFTYGKFFGYHLRYDLTMSCIGLVVLAVVVVLLLMMGFRPT